MWRVIFAHLLVLLRKATANFVIIIWRVPIGSRSSHHLLPYKMAPSCPDPFHFASPFGCFYRTLDGVERSSECSLGPADLWRLFPTLRVGKRLPETLDRPGTRDQLPFGCAVVLLFHGPVSSHG